MANQNVKIQSNTRVTAWHNHIRAWEEGDLSQAEFCRIHNLPIKSFYYWKKKYEKPPVSFIPINLKPDIFKQPATICLVVDNRYRLEIPNGFEPETLIKLLQILKA